MATVLVSDLKRLALACSSMKGDEDDFILRSSESRWGAAVTNGAHVAMMQIHFGVEGEPLPCDVGLSVSRFAALVKSLAGDSVEVTLDGNQFVATSGGRKRSMSIYDSSMMTSPRIPKLMPPCAATLPCDDLLAAVSAANSCGNAARITIGDGSVLVESWAGDGDAAFASSSDSIECEASGESTALYATDLLLLTLRPYKGRDVTIRSGPDYPIIIECGDDACLIAPRIEAE